MESNMLQSQKKTRHWLDFKLKAYLNMCSHCSYALGISNIEPGQKLCEGFEWSRCPHACALKETVANNTLPTIVNGLLKIAFRRLILTVEVITQISKPCMQSIIICNMYQTECKDTLAASPIVHPSCEGAKEPTNAAMHRSKAGRFHVSSVVAKNKH